VPHILQKDALYFLHIASVRSVEQESTTIISSAIPTRDLRQSSIFFSSLNVMTVADILIVVGIFHGSIKVNYLSITREYTLIKSVAISEGSNCII
jgi:hypothetical protein